MRNKVFISRDAASLSIGIEEIAFEIAEEAHKRDIQIDIIRTGSRGMFWLEPMIEVETEKGRVAYTNLEPEDIKSLYENDFLNGGDHEKSIGLIEEHPYLQKQKRLIFYRCGITDPLSLSDYKKKEGMRGLNKAISMLPKHIIEEVAQSGLRGRGGAGFPTGIKMQTVATTDADIKYVVCNADEGDSGTFSDRMIMEGDPFLLIEGMTIAAMAVGAVQGYIYIRSEYPHAVKIMEKAVKIAREEGILGSNIKESGRSFDIAIRVGAGSYVCGEETALLESLEGKRGMVRYKPPLPAIEGLYGKPTLINNVMTLASIPYIIDKGSGMYAAHGTGRSLGTLPFQLAGNVKQAGLVEIPFGMTLRKIIEEFGEVTASGKPIKAVQVGGPLGAYLPEKLLDTPLDYEQFAAINAMVGHGGIVVFDDTVDMSEQARFAMEFCEEETCGTCTPCRIGATRGSEVIDELIAGNDTENNYKLLEDLCEIMVTGSMCAMGGLTPFPVISIMEHFSDELTTGKSS